MVANERGTGSPLASASSVSGEGVAAQARVSHSRRKQCRPDGVPKAQTVVTNRQTQTEQ